MISTRVLTLSVLGLLSYMPVVQADTSDLCVSILNQGIRDTQTVDVSEHRFNELRSEVCKSNYDTFSKASSASASGGLDVPGIVGVSGSEEHADQVYSERRNNFCSADYAKATLDTNLRTYLSSANQAMLNVLDNCVKLTSEQFVRYVEPTPDGHIFIINFINKSEGRAGFTLSKLTLLDEITDQVLDPTKDCDLDSAIPYEVKEENALRITCRKVKEHPVKVSAKTSLGWIKPVSVAGVPSAPPGITERVTKIEGDLAALNKSVDKKISRCRVCLYGWAGADNCRLDTDKDLNKPESSCSDWTPTAAGQPATPTLVVKTLDNHCNIQARLECQ